MYFTAGSSLQAEFLKFCSLQRLFPLEIDQIRTPKIRKVSLSPRFLNVTLTSAQNYTLTTHKFETIAIVSSYGFSRIADIHRKNMIFSAETRALGAARRYALFILLKRDIQCKNESSGRR